MTSPSDNSAAARDCGNKDVSVMPGATFTSRNHGVPAASTMRSVRDQSRRPRTRCAVSATSAQPLGDVSRKPCRAQTRDDDARDVSIRGKTGEKRLQTCSIHLIRANLYRKTVKNACLNGETHMGGWVTVEYCRCWGASSAPQRLLAFSRPPGRRPEERCGPHGPRPARCG